MSAPISTRRDRAKQQFPQVLLAVLGILQALALELLWERGVLSLDRWREVDALAAGVLQALAVFMGVVVIWVLFATVVLRFEWLPRFRDLIFPFVLGGLQFMLIESMAPEHAGRWFLLLAVVFGVASVVSYQTFTAAIAEDPVADPEVGVEIESFVPSVVMVVALGLLAWLVSATGAASAWTLGALVLANAGLVVQLWVLRAYWHRDLGDG
ncbi:MAG: hypothetical protein AAF430_07220 [Myxococcota bacterium]